jgi:hypothetical protein
LSFPSLPDWSSSVCSNRHEIMSVCSPLRPDLGVLMVLEVRVVVSAIAGVAIMAAMAIAPYRLRISIELLNADAAAWVAFQVVQAVSKKLARDAGAGHRRAEPAAHWADAMPLKQLTRPALRITWS